MKDYLVHKKHNAMSENEADKYVKHQLVERKEVVAKQIERDNFYYWIMERYNFEIIPTRFFKCMSEVEHGIYKNMKRPIPLSDLTEMWYSKESQMRAYDDTRGIYGDSRLYYDLTVLISHYQEYLDYKERQHYVQNEYTHTIDNLNNLKDMMKYVRYDEDNGVADMMRELEGINTGD